jgi:hypothetical protein
LGASLSDSRREEKGRHRGFFFLVCFFEKKITFVAAGKGEEGIA